MAGDPSANSAEAAFAAAMNNTQAGGSTTTPTLPVFFGNFYSAGAGAGHTQSYNHDDNPDGPKAPKQHVGSDIKQLTPDEAAAAWYQFDDAHRQQLMDRMWYLGLTKSKTDFDNAFQVWTNAVQHAARFAMVGKPIDPKDMIEMLADGRQGAGAKTRQSTTSSIDLTDPEQAKAWVTQAYLQSMGRAPDPAEVRSMADALLAQAKAHPRITTTTSVNQFDDQGNPTGDSHTTVSGGFDAQSFLQNQMQADPEATAHQAAAQYLPALHALLGAGV